MSLKLRLVGETDVLDLNGIADTGYGYQALTGANGLGLPPVTPQWLEGAGDGALYRGRRVRARDIDIPLDIVAEDREGLKDLVARLSKVLAYPCTLYIEEPSGALWYTEVIRSGGGGFVYGTDTIGQRDMQVVITLTAGDPFFTSAELETRVIQQASGATPFLDDLSTLPLSPDQAIGTITVENTGDAPAWPTWTVIGPGTNFQIVSPTGELLRWEGSLAVGETLTVDTKAGTVTDGLGNNRYADLAPAPRFWAIPAGTNTVEASLSGTTTASRIVCSWQARKWMVV